MPEIKLKIEDLILDHDNPRITHAEGQQEALQKVLKDQKTKLVKLAQSITARGLNPMDRFLVLRVDSRPLLRCAYELDACGCEGLPSRWGVGGGTGKYKKAARDRDDNFSAAAARCAGNPANVGANIRRRNDGFAQLTRGASTATRSFSNKRRALTERIRRRSAKSR